MTTRVWTRIRYFAEALSILVFVPFALYPSPVTLLVLVTLPAAVSLIIAAFRPSWFDSRLRWRRYSHWSSAGCGLALIALGIWFASRPPPAIHVLSVSYRGPVIIVFGCAAARPAKHEGRAKVYEIPDNGILLLSDEFDGREPRVYRVGAHGERASIAADDSGNAVDAHFNWTGNSWGSPMSRGVSFEYVIGGPAEWANRYELKERAHDEAVKLSAARCSNSR